MKCEEFRQYLDNYEILTDFQKSEMTDHASKCEACQAELDFFLSMLDTARTLPKIEPPQDFMENLNSRLDAEDKKARGAGKIVYHVRANWKQYVTAAACLALVAALTANRDILLNRIEGTEDGVITEETAKTPHDNAGPNGASAVVPTAAPAEAVNTPAAEAEQTASAAPAASAPRQTASVASAQPARRAAVETPAYNAEVITENINTAEAYDEPAPTVEAKKSSNAEGYKIALGGNVQNETASYNARVSNVSESGGSNEIKENYSVAVRDDSLALGRYYRIDQDGNPIEEDNEPKAIGSLNISSADAERAMDVINMYPHGEDGDFYTTDSANFTLMLSMLSSEGVSYTNYTPAGSGDVKFKIVFN